MFPLKRKLEINDLFQPVSVEDGDELYPNGFFIFNITKLTNFIKNHPEIFTVENIPVASLTRYSSSNLKESTIETANIQEPIILAEIAPEKFNLIDGHHRLERACRDGVLMIPAYKVFPMHHCLFLTSIKAYQEYVQYWNMKLENMKRVS